MFCNILVGANLWHVYHVTEIVQAEEKPVVVSSITVVSAFILLHSVCNLKTTQMNVQRSLIRELMLYEFDLGHNATEATKKNTCAKAEGVVGHSAAT